MGVALKCHLSIDSQVESLEILEIGTLVTLDAHNSPFGSVWAHSLTLSHTSKSVNVIIGLHSWPAPFHALVLVMNPRLRS
jgi:hypothetical protein